jgi:hypothetical protein
VREHIRRCEKCRGACRHGFIVTTGIARYPDHGHAIATCLHNPNHRWAIHAGQAMIDKQQFGPAMVIRRSCVLPSAKRLNRSGRVVAQHEAGQQGRQALIIFRDNDSVCDVWRGYHCCELVRTVWHSALSCRRAGSYDAQYAIAASEGRRQSGFITRVVCTSHYNTRVAIVRRARQRHPR